MLFALEWIKSVLIFCINEVTELLQEIDFSYISLFITRNWIHIVFFCIAGVMLCFLGFRFHKIAHGMIGAIVLGRLGWNLGEMINKNQITIAIIYSISFAIVGYFVLYILYFVNVFWGIILFVCALCNMALNVNFILQIFLAVLSGVLMSIVYIKYKLPMSAIVGALILTFVVYSFASVLAFALSIELIIGGIIVQHYFRKQLEEKKRIEFRKQVEKYPYGPGIAYGWEDPTLKKLDNENKSN